MFQIEQYRRRFAEIEGRLAIRELDDSGDLGSVKLKEEWLLSPKFKMQEIGDAEFASQLEDERKRFVILKWFSKKKEMEKSLAIINAIVINEES